MRMLSTIQNMSTYKRDNLITIGPDRVQDNGRLTFTAKGTTQITKAILTFSLPGSTSSTWDSRGGGVESQNTSGACRTWAEAKSIGHRRAYIGNNPQHSCQLSTASPDFSSVRLPRAPAVRLLHQLCFSHQLSMLEEQGSGRVILSWCTCTLCLCKSQGMGPWSDLLLLPRIGSPLYIPILLKCLNSKYCTSMCSTQESYTSTSLASSFPLELEAFLSICHMELNPGSWWKSGWSKHPA